jgi:hypothetical protein
LIGTWTLISVTSGEDANQTPPIRPQSKRHDDGGC